MDTIGNCQRLAFTVGVSQHMHKIKKNTLVASWSNEVVCFQMLGLETSKSKSEASKSNWWKITSSSKTLSLQRELFLTMFYTINLSPITRNQERFYANNYFE